MQDRLKKRSFLCFPVDIYIGLRYIVITIYRRTIYQKAIEGADMNDNIVLTEATYYILLSLYNPQHGYGIMQEAERLSNGRVRLAAGTLYGALNAMVDKGWIIQLPVEDGSRKKNYQLTAVGLSVLESELERLKELVRNGEEVLGG